MHTPEPQWWYLSFATVDRFLGGLFIDAPTMDDAVTKAHQLDQNPGGHVLGFPIDPEDLPPSGYRRCLLTRAKLVHLDAVATGSDGRVLTLREYEARSHPETSEQ